MKTPAEYRQYDKDNGQAGAIAPTCFGLFGQAAAAPTAQRAYLLRFVPSRRMIVTSVNFVVTTAAGANDNVDVGIYDATYTKLVSSGATAGKLNATGPQSVAVAATTLLPRQVYYLAISTGAFGGTSPQLWSGTLTGNAGDIYGTGAGVREVAQLNATHPLTSPITPSGPSIQFPLLAVRES